MADLFGGTGLGIGLSAKPDYTLEKMELAQEANQAKAAAKQQEQDNAYTDKLNQSLKVSDNLLPVYATQAKSDAANTLSQTLGNMKSMPNNFRATNETLLNDYNGRLSQINANSYIAKEAYNHLDNYDPETQSAILKVVNAKSPDELQNIKPVGEWSNFKNNGGNFSFNPIPKVSDADQPAKYVNAAENQMPLNTISKYVGGNQAEFQKLASIPKDGAELQTMIKYLKDNYSLSDADAQTLQASPTAEKLAMDKFKNPNIVKSFGADLHNNLDGKASAGDFKTNKEVFYKDGDLSKPLPVGDVYNNLQKEYLAEAKNAVATKITSEIKSLPTGRSSDKTPEIDLSGAKTQKLSDVIPNVNAAGLLQLGAEAGASDITPTSADETVKVFNIKNGKEDTFVTANNTLVRGVPNNIITRDKDGKEYLAIASGNGMHLAPVSLNRDKVSKIRGSESLNTTAAVDNTYTKITSIKDPSGNTIKAGIRGGKWYNTETGQEIK